ncbi:hypothetical protein FGB62_87g049 [Gracilaria domingensis]|nr:hypothetical protein FGB62_87g049 [Gracilaria domingensis]
MRRAVMEPIHDAKLREQAEKVYKAIGLPLPEERTEEQKMRPRSHGGFELISTFVPTPEAPKLNAVHGPLANQDSHMTLKKDVIGFPMPGAGMEARMRAETQVGRKNAMQVEDDEYEQVADRPYFYPRRERRGGGIKKKRLERKVRNKSKSKGTRSAMQVEVAT